MEKYMMRKRIIFMKLIMEKDIKKGIMTLEKNMNMNM